MKMIATSSLWSAVLVLTFAAGAPPTAAQTPPDTSGSPQEAPAQKPSAAEAGEREGRAAPRGEGRFLDLNGDGINDLVRDRDGDGIPDQLDPMFRGPRARYRGAWFRSMPDSARADSGAFRSWWNSTERPHDWQQAWDRWQVMRERGDGSMMMAPGTGDFQPRGSRFRDDIRDRRGGGRPGGGGHGGGGSGGGPGGPKGGSGGGGGRFGAGAGLR